MSYTVRSGDTLGAIAARHHTTVAELQRLNGVADPNRISVGQQLRLPGDSASGQAVSSTGGTPASAGTTEAWSTTVMKFVDAIGRPIVGLVVRLTTDGTERKATTNAQGCVEAIVCEKPRTDIEVHVTRSEHKGGGEKRIGSYTPVAGVQTVRVQSGKQVESTKIRRHEGTAQTPPVAMKSHTPGSKIETATIQGNPLTCVKCGECPNGEDLLLGANLEFRDLVVAAAKRAGVIPQAVAAVMNAEASKEKGTGKWKADSKSPNSSATGMTQFLDGTWIGEALRAGTYLNAKAKKAGWLVQGDKGDWQFVRSDGTRLAGPKLLGKLQSLVTSRRSAVDANLQCLLDLRLEAEYAIHAAMDYGKANLDALVAKGYKVDGLNDVEKARMMYLCHHLGLGDAVHFIQNTIPEEDVFDEDRNGKKKLKQNGAKKLLVAQLGSEKRAESQFVSKNGGSWVGGHRMWLQGFIGNNIKPTVHCCPGDKRDELEVQELKSLTSLTDGLKK